MISAKEAREMTETAELNKQLIQIETRILTASRSGRSSITLTTISPKVKQALKNLGYSVSSVGSYWAVCW